MVLELSAENQYARQVRQVGYFPIQRHEKKLREQGPLDAKLVTLPSRRDFIVAPCINVWINPQRNGGGFPHSFGDRI